MTEGYQKKKDIGLKFSFAQDIASLVVVSKRGSLP
jgi:hypothetical protein